MLYSIRNLVKERVGEHTYRLVISHLEIAGGSMLAITGPSGCGKSTTMDILGLALACDSAETFCLNASGKTYDIARLFHEKQFEKLAWLRRTLIGYVLQTGELLPYLSVLDNMTLTARMNGIAKDAAEERACMLAKHLGIGKHVQVFPDTLSVGERQRAAIVRALVPKPGILLADEPTAALDPVHAATVLDVLFHLVREEKTTLILITHDTGLLQGKHITTLRFRLEEEESCVSAILDDRERVYRL